MRIYTSVVQILMIGCCIQLINCTSGHKRSALQGIPAGEALKEGKLLADRHCQSCHVLPQPSLLNKDTWRDKTLPVMGLLLGLKPAGLSGIPRSKESDLNYLPEKPALDSVDWNLIVNYYTAMAPQTLPQQKKRISAIRSLPFFKVQLPSEELFGTNAMASYVKIDTTRIPHRLIVNDGLNKILVILNDKLQLLKRYSLNEAVVDMYFTGKSIMVCTIGKELAANNFKNGNIREIKINKDGTLMNLGNEPVFGNLARPVTFTEASLNNDDKKDYLISEYGNLAGRLCWMEGSAGGKFTRHILREKPGCLKTIVKDVDRDGKADIWALFAQGDEGIFLFSNEGSGVFKERKIMGFPPTYGSTSFELADFNGDGSDDIIYTCGDNADYSQILKPYHGLYIFLNDGKNNFKQKYFYPVNGCYKTISFDFDGDGDLDIASISDFAAAATPWESFLYFENRGGFDLQPYTLPAGTPFQKGLTMDAADLDGDGRKDLILGNGFYTSDKSGRYTEPLFIVLKNIVK